MDLHLLYDMQQALDQHIEEKHGLLSRDLTEQKILALLVELGELANETRCFKFWSLKESSPQETILEEFVDGVHFILSLGLTCGLTVDKVSIDLIEHATVTEQFLQIYQSVLEFREERSYYSYVQLLNGYFTLGAMLGFDANEVIRAYIAKNEVNYNRQQEGY